MVLIPSEEQVGALVLIIGVAGTGNTAPLLNEAEAADVQLPLPAVTV